MKTWTFYTAILCGILFWSAPCHTHSNMLQSSNYSRLVMKMMAMIMWHYSYYCYYLVADNNHHITYDPIHQSSGCSKIPYYQSPFWQSNNSHRCTTIIWWPWHSSNNCTWYHEKNFKFVSFLNMELEACTIGMWMNLFLVISPKSVFLILLSILTFIFHLHIRWHFQFTTILSQNIEQSNHHGGFESIGETWCEACLFSRVRRRFWLHLTVESNPIYHGNDKRSGRFNG